MAVRQWDENIRTLKMEADRVKLHEKHEYDRLIDLLVVKLSSLSESVEKLESSDEINDRTKSIIRKILLEMKQINMDALSMLK